MERKMEDIINTVESITNNKYKFVSEKDNKLFFRLEAKPSITTVLFHVDGQTFTFYSDEIKMKLRNLNIYFIGKQLTTGVFFLSKSGPAIEAEYYSTFSVRLNADSSEAIA